MRRSVPGDWTERSVFDRKTVLSSRGRGPAIRDNRVKRSLFREANERLHDGQRDELAALRADAVADVVTDGDATIVRLAGEIDLYNAEAVREALRKASTGAGAVVVDLSSVDFADSTTIGILLETRSRLNGRPLVLVAPPPQVVRALQACGVDGRLPIYATLAAALSA